jgi:hypothetical protein
MPDIAKIETGREGTAFPSCPECKHVPLFLFALSAGVIEHARVGCLCRSLVVRSHANLSGQPAHHNAPTLRAQRFLL